MDKRQLYGIFKVALQDFIEDNNVIRAAALTFFIILPLPTLLLLATGLFSIFFGQTAAIQIVVHQISAVAGPAIAGLFSLLIMNTGSPFSSIWTTIVVVGFSIGGAIGAFSVLRDTMDRIWEVTLPKGRPLWKRVRQRVVPFAVVSALGLVVIVWTAIASSIFVLIKTYSFNGTLAALGIAIAEVVTSFVVATFLLAIIYKMIPEARVHWQDVTVASLVTGVAFTVTNYVFGAYIAYFTPTTVAGAAGALLIILLWIFVLNQIVLYGAETSKVYATTVGVHSRRHLPESLEKIIQPLEWVGERVEEATKEDVVPTGETAVTSSGETAAPEPMPKEKEKGAK
jgi:membrane protein